MHWAPQPVPRAVHGYHQRLSQLRARLDALRPGQVHQDVAQSARQKTPLFQASSDLAAALADLSQLSCGYLSPEFFQLGLSLLSPFPQSQAALARLAWAHYPSLYEASSIACEAQNNALEAETQALPSELCAWLWPTQKPWLSVCMIVRNEAECLGEALRSVDPFADEIIVVDTGSEDQTQEIARRFEKVKLFETPWQDHFAQARNVSLKRASGDWVLVLDADETLVDSRALEILITHPPRGWMLYALSVQHDLEQAGRTQTWTPRLFRRDGIRYTGALHELPVKKEAPHFLQTVFPKIAVRHVGGLQRHRERQSKDRRDAALKAWVEASDATPYLHYQYAHYLAYTHRQTESETERAQADALILKHLHIALRETQRYLGDLPPHADWLEAPLPATLLLMAQVLLRQKEYEALRRLGDAYTCPYTEYALLLAQAHIQNKNWRFARQYCVQALNPELLQHSQAPASSGQWRALHPREIADSSVYLCLIQIGLQSHQAVTALFAVRRLLELYPHGQCPGVQGNLVEVHRRLSRLVGIREGEFLLYLAGRLRPLREQCGLEQRQFSPERLDPEALDELCFLLLCYLWESWSQEVLVDALLVFQACGLESLVGDVSRLGAVLYPQERLFRALQPVSTLSPQTRAYALYPGGWHKLFERPGIRPRVSLHLMGRDVEDVLPRALASCEGLIDTYFLMDTGSTDRSREIMQAWLENHSGQFLQRDWRNNFADMRNMILEQGSTGWVLSLDADEALEPAILLRLRELFCYRPRPWQIFALRIHNLDDDPLRQSQSWVPRIFAAHPLLRYTGRVHERPQFTAFPHALPVHAFSGRGIQHWGYQSRWVRHHDKAARRHLLLASLELQGHANPLYLYHYAYFLIAHQQPPDEAQAEQLLRQALSENQKHRRVPPVVGWVPASEPQVQMLLLRLWQRQQRHRDILQGLERWRLNNAEAYYYAAEAALKQAHWALARALAFKALEAPVGEFPAMGFGGRLALLLLVEVAWAQNDWELGLNVWMKLLELDLSLQGHYQSWFAQMLQAENKASKF